MIEQSLDGVLKLLDTTQESPVLFTISPRFNSNLNLRILSHLIRDRGQKGLYLTIDRPATIMKRLLVAKKIDLRNLIFLDPISKVSGMVNPKADSNVRLMENPFFRDIMQYLSEEGHTSMKKEGIDFLMIDNLSALSCYMDILTMSSMLTALSRWTDLRVFMCVDDLNQKVHDQAKAVCTKEVRFNDHMVPEFVP